jgi:hypothetical protein
VGAYSPVTNPQETSSLSQDAAPVAWDAFNNKHTMTGCAASTVHAVSYNVTQACKQVPSALHSCTGCHQSALTCPEDISTVASFGAGGGWHKLCALL